MTAGVLPLTIMQKGCRCRPWRIGSMRKVCRRSAAQGAGRRGRWATCSKQGGSTDEAFIISLQTVASSA
jgi:hypothetical protein